MEEIDNDELLELIHKRYGLPTTEWKDFNPQLATLDLGRLMGVIIRLRGELKAEAAELAEFRDHIRWMAQTVHQGYHTDDPGAWNGSCEKDICSSTRRFLKEWR